MARIRTIKPEFPQSESMGNISRDARLLFIQMWTLADDEGRLRGNSRMLASLLFPYDDDANDLIDDWLTELSDERCIVRYACDGSTYIQICNWLNHQKIDKPSKSKIPEFEESSRILANPRECSSEDLRIKDQGSKDQGEDQNTLVDAHASTTHERLDGKPDLQLASETQSPAVPQCPHLEIISAYNTILPELQHVLPERWDGTRKKHLQARWRESDKHQSIAFWEKFFRTLRGYPFYLGENDRSWRATLGWMVEKKHFDDLLEKFISDSKRNRAAA